jgi:hypothetical protein
MAQFEEQPIERWVKPTRTTGDQFDFTEPDNLLARDYIQGNKIQLVRNITPSGTSSQTVILTDGTDNVIINADGSVFEGFTVLARNTRGSAGATAIYTVPANKVADIYTALVFSANTTADNFDAQITANNVEIATYNFTSGAVNTYNAAKPTRLTAGQVVNLNVSRFTAGTAIGVIGYIERNV